jgi:hypothetical protein
VQILSLGGILERTEKDKQQPKRLIWREMALLGGQAMSKLAESETGTIADVPCGTLHRVCTGIAHICRGAAKGMAVLGWVLLVGCGRPLTRGEKIAVGVVITSVAITAVADKGGHSDPGLPLVPPGPCNGSVGLCGAIR